MEGNYEDLEMGLFDSLNDLEVNLDIDTDDIENDIIDDETSELETDDNLDNPLDEDESSEEVVEDEDHEEEGDDADGDLSPNIYSSFATVLNEQGLLPSLDLQSQKVETIDDLTTVFKQEIDAQVKTYLVSKIGQDGVDALEKGISLAEYQQYQDNILTLDNITEETLSNDIELSKKIIYQDYINQGFDDSRAMRLLKKSIDAGEESIIEDALESLSSLKVLEDKRLAQLSEQRAAEETANRLQQETIDNDLKNAIYNSKELIQGIPLNKTIQDKVYNSITKIVSKSPNGIMENKLMKDRRENPIGFDTKLYYLYELTNNFTDFSKLVAKSESKAISKLEKQLRKTKFEDAGTPSYLTDPNSYGGIGAEIVF